MPTTMPTLEIFRTAIRLASCRMDVQTVMAGLRCVGWIDSNHFDSCTNRLIKNKHPQLIKRPTITTSTLCLITRQFVGALPDACQILHSNNSVKCFGLLHDCFADSMVQPLLIASLSSRQPLPNLSRPTTSRSCAFRAFTLERCSDSTKPISNLLNVSTVPLSPNGCYSNISTEVCIKTIKLQAQIIQISVTLDICES